MEIEKYEQQVPEGEPVLDQMAQQVQNMFRFKNFYDQTDLDAWQCLVIMKALIKLENLSRGLGLV